MLLASYGIGVAGVGVIALALVAVYEHRYVVAAAIDALGYLLVGWATRVLLPELRKL